jgi:hypothetical protein
MVMVLVFNFFSSSNESCFKMLCGAILYTVFEQYFPDKLLHVPIYHIGYVRTYTTIVTEAANVFSLNVRFTQGSSKLQNKFFGAKFIHTNTQEYRQQFCQHLKLDHLALKTQTNIYVRHGEY